MKKNLLIIILIVLILFLFLVAWRLRAKRGQLWQRRYRREAPLQRITTPQPIMTVSPTPTPVVPTTVEENLEDIDEIMGTLNPQKDFSDIPDKDLGL